MNVLFIGGGNMAQAILGGLLAEGVPARNFCVVEPVQEARDRISALGVAADERVTNNVLDYDAIILAVKPQMMREAIAPLASQLKSQIVISIAAGVGTATIGHWLGDGATYENVVRAMPNTPALIRAGITGMYSSPVVGEDGRRAAESLLAAVGETVWFEDEAMLDVVTAVSGSGPAYVFYFIEALEQAALELGFNQHDARLFAKHTFLGGARLAAESDEPASTLRARVTSKRGTTEAAVRTFDQRALKQGFVDGVRAAYMRSRELGLELAAAPTPPSNVAGGAH
ncbi:MAG: pyrroline-5-carboxylate reductase [Betaproteobacteria bacterium]